MRSRTFGIAVVGSAFVVVGCSLLTDLSSLAPTATTGDASTGEAAAPGSFLLTASPAHVTLDPKDTAQVAIGITRGQDFTDIVDVTVNDLGNLSGIATSPQTLTFTGSSPVTLHLDVPQGVAVPQDGTITLLGIGRSTQKSATVMLVVRLGSVWVDTTTSTSVTVPPWAKALSIKAWGGGGGAGGGFAGTDSSFQKGGAGGGAGLAGAVVPVQGGDMLTISVAQGGKTSVASGGGGGGGCTRVSDPAVILVAPGGGGGGSAWPANACGQAQGGAAGGAGGDSTAPNAATPNAGGSAGDGTASPGTSFSGGAGSGTSGAAGGTLGGGVGGRATCGPTSGGGGGGGGGYFGGGGGATAKQGSHPAGGGGSAFIMDGGADAMALSGAAVLGDSDYKPGTASGGTPAPQSTSGLDGAGGRVLIRFVKP